MRISDNDWKWDHKKWENKSWENRKWYHNIISNSAPRSHGKSVINPVEWAIFPESQNMWLWWSALHRTSWDSHRKNWGFWDFLKDEIWDSHKKQLRPCCRLKSLHLQIPSPPSLNANTTASLTVSPHRILSPYPLNTIPHRLHLYYISSSPSLSANTTIFLCASLIAIASRGQWNGLKTMPMPTRGILTFQVFSHKMNCFQNFEKF